MSTYIRWEGTVRETKTVVQILDLLGEGSEFAAELSPEGKVINRWATVCVDHAWIVTHPTSQLAWDHAAHPLGWCEPCQGIEPTPQEQEAAAEVVEAYNGLTKNGKKFMHLVGTHFFDFFDDGIVTHSGNWGSNMAGQAYGTLGVKERSMAGIMNGTLKAGLWTTQEDDQDAGNGLWWSLTETGAKVARYAATQS